MAKRKRPAVKTLVPEDDKLPMAATVQRFIKAYMECMDLKTAASSVGLMPDMGVKLFKNPRIYKAIQHRMNLLEMARIALKAKADSLSIPLLDASLAEEVKSKKNGHVRVRAIELGYKRVGLIRDGEFYVQPDQNSGKSAPSIYQSMQLTQRRTVTEEVTQTMTKVAHPAFAVQEY